MINTHMRIPLINHSAPHVHYLIHSCPVQRFVLQWIQRFFSGRTDPILSGENGNTGNFVFELSHRSLRTGQCQQNIGCSENQNLHSLTQKVNRNSIEIKKGEIYTSVKDDLMFSQRKAKKTSYGT